MTGPADASLPDGEDRALLTATEGLLLRPLHPQWIKNGEINVSAFLPIKVDEGEFSVDRASLSTPEESYQRRIRLKRKSAGTWGIAISAVIEAGSRALADPIFANEAEGIEANPAHAVIDFRGLDADGEEDLATVLWEDATQRGCLYKAPPPT